MNKEYDIDLIIPLEAFKSNQARTLKQEKIKRGNKKIRKVMDIVIENIFLGFMLFFLFYCFTPLFG